MIIEPGQWPEGELAADVCIVGAGAAGIALACELDGSGRSVLLVDAGGFRPDLAWSNELYAGSADAPHPAPTEFRRIGFGGTTGIWGGRCVPFDPIDFERRDWLPGSGWPIGYDEVARHYARALAYCDAGEFDFSVGGSLPGAPPTIPGAVDAGVLRADRIERYSLPTDFGKRYRERLARSQDVRVLPEARCVAIVREPGAQRVAAIEVADRAQRRRRVVARRFVLATGGIETVRLLLASDPEGPGLGNRSDKLGRYYACHFENVIGRVVPAGARLPFHFERTRDGVYCRRKLQFAEGAQREHRLLNSAFRLHFPDYSDASHGSAVMSAIYLAKSLLLPEYQAILQHGSHEQLASPRGAHLRNVLAGMPQLVRFSFQMLFGRVLAQRKLPYTLEPNADGSFPLEFNCEQTPLESSRITLGEGRDAGGLPRVHVQWRLAPEDVAAAQRGFLLLRDALGRTGTCTLQFDEASLAERLRHSVPLGGHHIGCARMAASAAQGVVDADCALFELPNLHVASSAVFPTASHANPTLTIVALAMRLADRLKAA